MIFIYLDESGDLGFDFTKNNTSSYFSIALLILNEQRPIISLVRKVFTSLPRAIIRRSNGILHSYYEKPITRERLLRGLAKREVKIASMRLDKRNVLLTESQNELYATIVITLINRLYKDRIINDSENITLVASRMHTSKNLNTKFDESVTSQTKSSKFNVSIVKPSDDKCLQAVDFVSWALWQKYENRNDSYSKIIADKIVKEYVMYE